MNMAFQVGIRCERVPADTKFGFPSVTPRAISDCPSATFPQRSFSGIHSLESKETLVVCADTQAQSESFWLAGVADELSPTVTCGPVAAFSESISTPRSLPSVPSRRYLLAGAKR